MSFYRLVVFIFLSLMLTAGMCEADTPPPQEPPESAAERLQGPRTMYKGNINENLQELQFDLEKAAKERKDRQDRATDSAQGR